MAMGTSDTNRTAQAGQGGRARDLGSIGESRSTDAASLDRSDRVPAGPIASMEDQSMTTRHRLALLAFGASFGFGVSYWTPDPIRGLLSFALFVIAAWLWPLAKY
jgi:hypothetical protein